jgi:hypothetical protein
MRPRLLIPRSFGRGRGASSRLNRRSPRPIVAGMAKKLEPPPLPSFDIYKIASKAVWLGTVEAPDKVATIEKVAKELKVDVWRLFAEQRR